MSIKFWASFLQTILWYTNLLIKLLRSRSWKGKYVTGLQGRLPRAITVSRNRFPAGTLWQIRWDYDPFTIKGSHVNFRCGGLKYAFRCEAEPRTDSRGLPINDLYSPARYYSAILDQTNAVKYCLDKKEELSDGQFLAEWWKIRIDSYCTTSRWGIEEGGSKHISSFAAAAQLLYDNIS